MTQIFDFDGLDPLSELDEFSLGPEALEDSSEEDDLGNDEDTLHESSQVRYRRKSSMYRRISINFPSSVVSTELVIPENYDNYNDIPSIKEKGGKKLSDFEPIKVIGQGAYGKVYLVQDKITKQLFASKQLKKPVINIFDGNSTHDTHVERTISERQILSNITHHKNIVKLFYAFQDEEKFYLILDYIPGGELFRHLSENNPLGNVFKEEHAAFYAAEMALGLHHLHQLGIVYRDLKPENCLLDAQGHLVLTDFGLSKSLGTSSQKNCTSIIGTPEYMAPEILKGEKYDFAVDWWSLGCVIYDMMSGKPPFAGSNHKTITKNIVHSKVKFPFYFSMDATDILGKLLNKNSSKRLKVDEDWNKFKSHRFFRKVDWNSLSKNLPCECPIVPKITDPILAENFSDEFKSMRISTYDQDSTNLKSDDLTNKSTHFEGFSYVASGNLMEEFCNSSS